MHENIQLGRMIHDAWKKTGMSQQDLATKMGVSKATPRKWFNTGKISRENLFKLGRILDLPVVDIISGESGGRSHCENEDELSAYAMRQLIELFVEMRVTPSAESFKRIYDDVMSVVRNDCIVPTKTVIKIIAEQNTK